MRSQRPLPLLSITIAAFLMLGTLSAAAAPQTTSSAIQPSLTRLQLAKAHLEYLLLDEVVAGRAGAFLPDVDMARAYISYLLLPEVQAGKGVGPTATD